MSKKKVKHYAIAGRRLRIAREILSETQESIVGLPNWKDIVDIYNPRTIGAWETKGVPENRLGKLADFFNIDPSLFYKEDIKDENFREIVGLRKNDPKANIDHLLPSKFDKGGLDEPVDEDDLEEAIDAYHQKVRKKPCFRGLENVFTPMEMLEITDSDYENSLKNEEVDQQIRKGTISEIMNQASQLVLLGEPGTGKTTCLKWRWFKFIKDYQQGDKTAIYVPLAKYQPANNLVDFICHISSIRLEFLRYILKQKRLILLLDAYNECPARLQDKCLGQIISFHACWRDTPLILTSRILPWSQKLNFPVFAIQPLPREKQVHFLGAYLKDAERAKDILAQLYAQPDGKIIAKNPWMLFMISEIAREKEDLPQGRALIYSHYIREWYELEAEKIPDSGADLPWITDQILNDIRYIAAHMRLGGYTKEARLSWITETMGDKLTAEIKITDFPGQGMIHSSSRKANSFKFSHETLQEYLSAEYVLKKPDLLASVKPQQFSDWNMVLSYAFEIEKNPSQAFIEAAWRLNPLLVALVIKNIDPVKLLPLPKPDPFIRDAIHLLFEERLLQLKPNKDNKLDFSVRKGIKFFASPEIKYAFQTNRVAKKRFEILKSVLIKDATAEDAVNLKYHELASKEDFSDRKSVWVKNATAEDAIHLIHNGISYKEDFADRTPAWIKEAGFITAMGLIDVGLASKEDFKGRIPGWIEKATLNDALELILEEMAVEKDFADRIPVWIMEADKSTALRLIGNGFAKEEDFMDKISMWKKEGMWNPIRYKDLPSEED